MTHTRALAMAFAICGYCVATADDLRYERQARSGDWDVVAEIDAAAERPVLWTAMPRVRSLPFATFSCHASAGCAMQVFAEDPLPDGWHNPETRILIRVDEEPVFEVGGDVFAPQIEDNEGTKEMGRVLATIARGDRLRMEIYQTPEDRDLSRNGLTVEQSVVGFGEMVAWVMEQMYENTRPIIEEQPPASPEPLIEQEAVSREESR